MESLAFLVACLFLLVSVSGPTAVVLAHLNLWVLAVLCGAIAAATGFQWFFATSTWLRYLGLISALLGLGAIGFILSQML
jgi:hypothetical protein